MRADFKIIRHCVFQARQAQSINIRADYVDVTHKKVSNVVDEDSFFIQRWSQETTNQDSKINTIAEPHTTDSGKRRITLVCREGERLKLFGLTNNRAKFTSLRGRWQIPLTVKKQIKPKRQTKKQRRKKKKKAEALNK